MTSNQRRGKRIETIYISSDSEEDRPQKHHPSPRTRPNLGHTHRYTTRAPESEPEPDPEPDEAEVDEEPLSLPSAIDLVFNSPNLTDPCKRILLLLPQTPRGRYSTYKSIREHISATWHMTSVRAIQLAIQKNPCPGIIPCHRVVASNGGIGVYGTDWGSHGFGPDERREMLREEGARFDKNGRLLGPSFGEFESELSEVARAVREERERRMERMFASARRFER